MKWMWLKAFFVCLFSGRDREARLSPLSSPVLRRLVRNSPSLRVLCTAGRTRYARARGLEDPACHSSVDYPHKKYDATCLFCFLEKCPLHGKAWSVHTTLASLTGLSLRAELCLPCVSYCQPGLTDENFNQKPNTAKKRPEKGQTDCVKVRKKAKLFVVLLFLCHKEISKLEEYRKKISSKSRLLCLALSWSSLLMVCEIAHFG